MMEAVTDADPNNAWSNPNGEIGDFCESGPAGNFVGLPGTSWFVQQLWSNSREVCFAPSTPGNMITEPPVITNIMPNQGPVGPFDVTTPVTVTGSCFANPHAIVFEGSSNSPATVTATGFNQLTISVPSSPDSLTGPATLAVLQLRRQRPGGRDVHVPPLGHPHAGHRTSGRCRARRRWRSRAGPSPWGST